MNYKKICFKCRKEKKFEMFYRHSSMSDGFFNKCKDCSKIDAINNRNKNIERIREYDRNRGNRQNYEYIKKYRFENQKKYMAHKVVNYCVKNSAIKKSPCEVCGNFKSVAHHDDYDLPLNVRWLCQAHHKQWHSDNGPGING